MSRILVVDDDAPVVELVGRALEDEGFEVETASDAAEAVKKVAAQRPDLVLLDLEMPGIDGWGFLDHLRQTPGSPPVVILSGTADLGAATRAVRAGAVAFLPKPIHFGDVLSTCRKALAATATVSRAPAGVSERRRETRRPLLVGVKVRSNGADDRNGGAVGEMVDLSAGGVRMISVVPFDVGTRIDVTLDPAVVGGSVTLGGEVRWREAVATGHAHGLAFSGLPVEAVTQLRLLLAEPD